MLKCGGYPRRERKGYDFIQPDRVEECLGNVKAYVYCEAGLQAAQSRHCATYSQCDESCSQTLVDTQEGLGPQVRLIPPYQQTISGLTSLFVLFKYYDSDWRHCG